MTLEKIKCLLLILLFSACHNEAETSATSPINKKNSNPIIEKTFLEIGGEQQYVEIMGSSASDPVLLFLHGGPGWPQTPHLRYFNSDLTKHVILAAWEQAGCGQSFMRNSYPKNLSLEQSIKDAHQLTQILKTKFHKEKIYLAGFSWGSMIALILIERYPEDYMAYFGITQITNLRKSIQVSRDWIRQKANAQGDKKSLEILNKIEKHDTSICKREMDCFLVQYGLLSQYGGAVFRKESEAEISKAESMYVDYKKYDWFAGFKYSAYALEKDIFSTDLTSITELKIPVYFLMGRHDWNIPTSVTLEYFEKLKAPKKEIIWFENSGHELSSEEPAFFNEALTERIK